MRYSTKKPTAVFDTECFPNYWSIGFQSVDDRNRRKVFELFDGHELDKTAIAKIIRVCRICGYNSNKYDVPMLCYAMAGASNSELKRLNDELILSGTPHWVIMDRLSLRTPEFLDHIDLMPVSPGSPQMPSLKLLGGRLHSKRMQEMPVRIDDELGSAEREIVRSYHGNDLDTTCDLFDDLRTQLALRAVMSDEYGVDVRSKSDAQVAEAVIKAEMERVTGRKFYAPPLESSLIRYEPPAFISFETDQMKSVLAVIREASFRVGESDGMVKMPESVKTLRITLGNSVYQMGIGGLHSTESQISHYSDEWTQLRDRDVTSYYPKIIMNCWLYPKQMGPKFLDVYERIYDRRIAAKKNGDKNTAETLKIVLNGSFGKFGSPYSALYSPNLMLQTTITGQLALLMQIERLEMAGIEVVSANTDGVVSKVPYRLSDRYSLIYKTWEWETGFETEETVYKALHSRDVNNYIAIKEDAGKIIAKLKGAYTDCGPGLSGAAGQKKNPDASIAIEAAVDYLKWGTPIEETIEWATDFRKFITVRRVTGGAERDGMPIGKTIRWYYAKGDHPPMTYISSGNNVPSSAGAKPCMQMPLTMPADLDFEWYVKEAYAILQDVGARAVDPRLIGRTGTFMARLPDQKTFHIVDALTGETVCGRKRSSIRESWVERRHLPEDHRLCGKCKKGDDL